MGLLEALTKHMEQEYGGPLPKPVEQQVAECRDMVDLDVECSPVLLKAGDKEPVEIARRDGGFAVVWRNVFCPDEPNYEPITEDEVRTARARYLVTRGDAFRRFHASPREEQRHALRAYGLDGQVPAEHSPIAALFGMEGSNGRLLKRNG